MERGVLRRQSAGPGGGGGIIIPVAGLHVGVAGVAAGLQGQQVNQQGKGLRPRQGGVGVQIARVIPLDHPPEIQLLCAAGVVVVLVPLPDGDAVGKAVLLPLKDLQGPLRLRRRDGGEEPALLVVAGEGHRLPRVGVPHREEGLLRPVQGLPLGAGHPEGHIISARLAPAPPLRLLCRPGGGAQQGQTEAQRQYSLHGTHSLQHSIPICIIAPLVFPDKLQSNNKW